jgi:site-specific DNA recombinase
MILENAWIKLYGLIGQKNLVIDTLDSEILRSFIYKMISVSPNEIVYCIAGTKNYSDNEFKERRFDFLNTEPIVVGTYHKADGLTKMITLVVVIYFYKIDVSTHEKLYAWSI